MSRENITLPPNQKLNIIRAKLLTSLENENADSYDLIEEISNLDGLESISETVSEVRNLILSSDFERALDIANARLML